MPARPPFLIARLSRATSRLGVGGRLRLGFFAVALLTCVLGVYAVLAMGRVDAGQRVMYTDVFGGTDLFIDYIDQASASRINALAYLITDDPPARAALREQVAASDARMRDLAAQLDASDIDRADVATLAAMTAAWEAYATWRNQVLFTGIDATGAREAYARDGIHLVNAFQDAADAYRQQKRAVGAEVAASAQATYELSVGLAIALAGAAIGSALAIGSLLSRNITRAVTQVARAARGLAVGDLDQRIDLRSEDELGSMAEAVRQMIAYHREVAGAATAIAEGDLSRVLTPKSNRDVLGTAFQRMTRNLRAMVGELETQADTLGAQARLLDLAYDAVIVRDASTSAITYWNRAAENLYGWDAAEAFGRVTHALLGTRSTIPLEAIDATLARDGQWEGELVHTRRDGTQVVVDSRQAVQRDEDGRALAMLEINRDVTEQRRAADALAEARDVAESASRAKSEFLANMSHEIRTPMNAILGMAELLAESSLDDEQREYVQTFQRAGDTLLALINDILDLSKVEAGQVELEHIPFDLGELVEQTAEVLAIRAHAKGLELVVHVVPDLPTYVLGDPTRLRQVLTNLLGNALKFTDRGEVGVRVEPDPDATGPDWLRFTVWDSGIGIPADKQAAIFETFVQADASTTRRHGGTGLGLTISRRIVELMGGRISVTSEPGQGSRFVFTAPLAPAAPTETRSALPPIDVRGWPILVVDDNATNRLILRQRLAGCGARVSEVADGPTALAAAREARRRGEPFRVVLLDGRMPGMDGFEVAERLRDEVGTSVETVVMLTSDTRVGDMARIRELGLAAYLVKPVKRVELLQAISAVSGARALATAADAMPQVGAAAPAPEHAAERRQRLLLVDDSADNRMLIQAYLKKQPYDIDTAENGLAGLEKARAGDYDLVLMDMLMPVMDGLEATRAIRAWEQTHERPPVPVVALTANAMDSDVQRCLDAGCDGHVAKPVKKAALLESITHYARSRSTSAA